MVGNIIDQEYTKKVVKDYLAQKQAQPEQKGYRSVNKRHSSWSQKRRWVYNADLALQRQSFEMDLKYLSESNCLIIDAFVTFRLKEYVKYLKRFTEYGIEKVLMEAEHREFVRLLKRALQICRKKNEEDIVKTAWRIFLAFGPGQKAVEATTTVKTL